MIDELQKRRQELLAQKEFELERQARGEDNELELLVINEELLDVIAQIRALSPASWKWGHGRLTRNITEFEKSRSSIDRELYSAWMTETWSLDDEIDDERARLRKVAASAMELLTPRQREFLGFYANGMNCTQIASKLGLDRSGVATTMRRAKRSAKEAADWLMNGGQIISLKDPGVMKKVLVALSPWQAAHFYLFYSEGWTVQQVADLTGNMTANIDRYTRVARYNLGAALGGGNFALTHTEALDKPAYRMYCELKAHPELIPEYIPTPKGTQGPPIKILKNEKGGVPPGKLCAALMGRGPEMVQDMALIFTAIRRKLKPERIRWKSKKNPSRAFMDGHL